jgi:hypothetical protein
MRTEDHKLAVEVHASKELHDMARQLHRLARDIQASDEQTIAAELEALKPAIRRSAMATLPTRGGLDRLVANSELKVVRRRSRVTLRANNKRNIRRMNDRGILRHPVYARRDRPRNTWRWVDQRVPRKWFDNPTLASEMRLRRAVERNRQRILDRVR